MTIVFKLSMPSNNSWNGRWTGEENLYAIVKPETTKKSKERNDKLVGESFRYNFGDGWVAKVEVSRVDTKTASKIRKQSKGFCGYNWMVESILQHGEIRA